MKKIFLLLALMFGLSVSAQSYYKEFNAGKYAKALTEKIVSKLNLENPATHEKLQNATYIYAQSIKKHLLLAEKEGLLQGKSLDEAVKFVIGHYNLQNYFTGDLKNFLTDVQLEKVRELL